MGVPLKTQVEAWSDNIAAGIATQLAGLQSVNSNRTVKSLSDQLADSADPEVRNALGAAFLAVDRMALPENTHLQLQTILRQTAIIQAITDLDTQVRTYGGYDNIRAYLEAKSALVHPLTMEAIVQQLGPAALADSDSDINCVLCPVMSTIAPDRVYTGADGALAEDTTDALSAGTGDVALFASDDHTLYALSVRKFQGLVIALSTLASEDVEWTAQYWNGSEWATLDITDETAGLTRNDYVYWDVPDDWEPVYEGSGGADFADLTRRYAVRFQRTADAVTTPPVATCIRLVPTEILVDGTTGPLLGVQQPPVAIMRIPGPGANSIEVIPLSTVPFARVTEPVTLKARALTPIGADVTLTLTYVDQDGDDASAAQSAWSSIDALDTKTLALTGADGLRSVKDTSTLVSAATEGVFEIYVDLPAGRTPAL